MIHFSPRRLALLLALTLSVVTNAYGADAKPAETKLRVFTAGNSFHMWLPAWLSAIEKEAGVTPHEQLGVDYMASSWVNQHWDKPDDKHRARAVVESGELDVLTLGGMHTPDDGIDKFTEAGLAKNPKLIVTYQEFWLPFDRLDYPLMKKNFFGDLTKSLRTWEDATDTKKTPKDTSNFNIPTADQLDKLHQPYFEGIDKYIAAENKKIGKNVIRVVPVGQAVLALRRQVIEGKVPTIAKQSDLFVDNLGHPGDAIRAVAGYCHFIVIYHKNPKGIKLPAFAFVQRDNKFNQECNLILQDIAWNAVTNHPLSGFYHEKAE